MTITPQLGLFARWWIAKRFDSSGSSSDSLSVWEIGFVMLLTLMVLFFLYYILIQVIEKSSKTISVKEPLSPTGIKALGKTSFYSKLATNDKVNFEKRVQHYISTKMFTAEAGLFVTEEMKVLIAAAYNQIMFGLPVLKLTSFTHIHIVQDQSVTPSDSMQNSIIIPWAEFLEGYSSAEDGKNEGLKVLARYILKDNFLQAAGHGFFPAKKMVDWEVAADEESKVFMGGIYLGKTGNERVKQEYFGTAIVYFFELPLAFEEKYPQLFKATKRLLNQGVGGKGI